MQFIPLRDIGGLLYNVDSSIAITKSHLLIKYN